MFKEYFYFTPVGCGPDHPEPPDKWAVVETAWGSVKLDNISTEQVELWRKRGGPEAQVGVCLTTGTHLLVYLSDLR